MLSAAGNRGRRKLETDQEKIDRILDATEIVFGLDGVSHSNLSVVARRASVTEAELTELYPQLDDLFFATSLRWLREYTDGLRVTHAAHGSAPGYEQFRALIHQGIGFSLPRLPGFFLLFGEPGLKYPVSPEHPSFAEYQSLIRETVDFAVNALARGQAEGAVRADVSPDQLLMSMWGGALGLIQFERDDRVPRSGIRLKREPSEIHGKLDLLVESLQAKRVG